MFKPIGDIYRVITDVSVCLLVASADFLLHTILYKITFLIDKCKSFLREQMVQSVENMLLS